MNAQQRRTNSRHSLAAVGGIGAKAINMATGKQVMIVGLADKHNSVRVIRGDKRKIIMRVSALSF